MVSMYHEETPLFNPVVSCFTPPYMGVLSLILIGLHSKIWTKVSCRMLFAGMTILWYFHGL